MRVKIYTRYSDSERDSWYVEKHLRTNQTTQICKITFPEKTSEHYEAWITVDISLDGKFVRHSYFGLTNGKDD